MENCVAFPISNQGNPDSGGRGDGSSSINGGERGWNGKEGRETFAGRYVRIAMQPLHLRFHPFSSPHHSPLPLSPSSSSRQEGVGARPLPTLLAASNGESWDYLNFLMDFSVAFRSVLVYCILLLIMILSGGIVVTVGY